MKLLWIVFCILCVTRIAGADEIVKLSASEAASIAAKKNPTVEVARLAMQAGQAGVYEEEARFGRTLGLSLSHRMDREPSVSSLEQVTTSSTNFQSLGLGLTQRLGTGGKVELTVRQNRSASNAGYRTVNPVFGTDMELALTQPLQRGRGKVNRAALNIARNDLESAEVNLEGHVKELTANIKWAYWDMAFAYENLKVKRQLLEGALRVMETVTARVEMGEESRNSILLAELGVAQREEDIIVAQDHVLDAEGQLKVLMGLGSQSDVQLIPAISPGLVPFEDDLDLGLQRTLKQNADYRKSAITLRSRSLLVDQARDRARPEVNLTLRAGLSGIGANYSDDIRGLSDLEGRSWQGGFTLDIPLGAHAERERYHRRLSEFEQEKLNRNYQREKLVQQVKEDFRQVQTDRKRAEVARMAEELAERHVREEEDRLALGVSTVREVLDAQDDLAAARASKIKAIVDFNKSVVKWTHLTGQ